MNKTKIFAIAILTVLGLMVVGTCASQTRPAIPTIEKDTLFVQNSYTGTMILSLWEHDKAIIVDPWPQFVKVDSIQPIIKRIEGQALRAKLVTLENE